jgi:hypothetical protein
MKAYYGVDGRARLFRPMRNMDRFFNSMERIGLPVLARERLVNGVEFSTWWTQAFDKEELLTCLKRLVSLEKEWIPKERGHSLYIRPTAIGTQVCETTMGARSADVRRADGVVQASLGVMPSRACKVFIIMSPVGPYYPVSGFRFALCGLVWLTRCAARLGLLRCGCLLRPSTSAHSLEARAARKSAGACARSWFVGVCLNSQTWQELCCNCPATEARAGARLPASGLPACVCVCVSTCLTVS